MIRLDWITQLRLWPVKLLAPERWSVYLLLCLFAWLVGPAQAAPSDLDTSFNGTGIVSVDANDLTVLRNGRIVVASNNFPQYSGFDFTQYLTNGLIDTNFGTAGRVQTAILDSATATVIAQQPDLKLLAAGWARTGGTSIVALARYLPSGQLDGTFGIGGIVTVPGLPNVIVTSMKIQLNGSILVAGYLTTNLNSVLLRFTAAGQLDPGFGIGGVVNVSHGQAETVTVQTDGRILVAGITYTNPGYDTFLARYTADGAADAGFSVGGVATNSSVGTHVSDLSLALQPDGKILLGTGANGKVWLLRYLADGSLDPAFGNAGRTTTNVYAASGVAGIVMQSDGKILAVGSADMWIVLAGPPVPTFPTLIRYLANGQLDSRFANNGQILLTSMGTPGPHAPAQALALQSDGKILIAGAGLVRLLGDPTNDTRTIPTLSAGGLALLGLLMLLLAGSAARRRRERP